MAPWAKFVVVDVLNISVTANAASAVTQMLRSDPQIVDKKDVNK